MLFKSIVIASAVAALANAQTIQTSSASSVAPSSTVSQSMPPAATQGFNIGNTTSTDRFQWCLAQRNQCPQICGGAASLNDCDDTTLQYNCVCPNGTVPDCSAYQQTIPFFICQQTFVQCTANHPNDAAGKQQCTKNEQCGTRNATAEALAASSASAGPSSTSSSSGARSSSASATGSGASASASHSDATITTYTSGAFAAMLMAAFKLLL